jgi:hypothetical protein
MLIADFNLDLPLTRAAPPRLLLRHVFGIAAALVLHIAVALYLLLPTPAMEHASRPDSTVSTMSLVLIEPEIPIPAATPESAPPSLATAPAPAPPVELPRLKRKPDQRDHNAVPQPRSMSAEFIEPVITVADLVDDIERAAAEIVAKDPRLPNAGMPSALGKVPGRAEEFVHLPLQHRPPGVLQQTLQAIGKHLILGGLPDSPLQQMHDRAHRSDPGEAVCNDPENPLADERCWMPPED